MVNTSNQASPSQPTISVILCVNRSNPWLRKAINSVLEQDDTQFEFLIAANNCTNALWDELTLLTQCDPRIQLFRTSIGQLAFNLNFLADKASGEYLIRMDADDVCFPNRISVLRRELAKSSVDVLGSAVILIDKDDKPIGRMDFPENNDAIAKSLLSRTTFCHPAVAIRKQFLLDMQGYLGGYHSEDTDFWLRSRKAGACMRNLPEALLYYRVHPQQSISSYSGYSEVAAHWLRELLLEQNWYNMRGFFIALTKRILIRFLPRSQHYKTPTNKK